MTETPKPSLPTPALPGADPSMPRPLWHRLAFHKSGKPRGWLRKIILKDKQGTPRPLARRILFKGNGKVLTEGARATGVEVLHEGQRKTLPGRPQAARGKPADKPRVRVMGDQIGHAFLIKDISQTFQLESPALTPDSDKANGQAPALASLSLGVIHGANNSLWGTGQEWAFIRHRSARKTF